ncbi:hypothetical protein NX059_004513 [Plenodomus lindquistii]|nr:hypothetical protein NX059_004513 [Plenodomus lindquistii]
MDGEVSHDSDRHGQWDDLAKKPVTESNMKMLLDNTAREYNELCKQYIQEVQWNFLLLQDFNRSSSQVAQAQDDAKQERIRATKASEDLRGARERIQELDAALAREPEADPSASKPGPSANPGRGSELKTFALSALWAIETTTAGAACLAPKVAPKVELLDENNNLVSSRPFGCDWNTEVQQMLQEIRREGLAQVNDTTAAASSADFSGYEVPSKLVEDATTQAMAKKTSYAVTVKQLWADHLTKQPAIRPRSRPNTTTPPAQQQPAQGSSTPSGSADKTKKTAELGTEASKGEDNKGKMAQKNRGKAGTITEANARRILAPRKKCTCFVTLHATRAVQIRTCGSANGYKLFIDKHNVVPETAVLSNTPAQKGFWTIIGAALGSCPECAHKKNLVALDYVVGPTQVQYSLLVKNGILSDGVVANSLMEPLDIASMHRKEMGVMNANMRLVGDTTVWDFGKTLQRKAQELPQDIKDAYLARGLQGLTLDGIGKTKNLDRLQ